MDKRLCLNLNEKELKEKNRKDEKKKRKGETFKKKERSRHIEIFY